MVMGGWGMGANPLSCHLRFTCKSLCVYEGVGGPVSTLLLDGYIHRPVVLLHVNNT